MTRAVLLFHSIDDSGSPLSFPVRAFGALLLRLLRSGIPIVSFDKLRTLRQGVTLTFDDAIESVVHNVLPILRDLAMPAHVFITTARVGLDNGWESQPQGHAPMRIMDWDGIAACAAMGMTIENHTATHPDLRLRSHAQILDEYLAADEAIERRVGRTPTLLAYPFGWFNDLACELARERYAAAFTTRPDYFDDRCDTHAIPRIGSHYLRPLRLMRHPMSIRGRACVATRRILREVRDHL